MTLYVVLGGSLILSWLAVEKRSLRQSCVVWSIFTTGLWALGFALFAAGDARWVSLAAPVAGPLIAVTNCLYAHNQGAAIKRWMARDDAAWERRRTRGSGG